MNEVYIALGSNIGNRAEAFHSALNSLSGVLTDIHSSDWYETEAQEMATGHDHPFLNAVIRAKTRLGVEELLVVLQKIELKAGRVRKKETGYLSREIDLDILFFNNDIINTSRLQVPHPKLKERIFVLKPLMDLEPGKMVPGLNKTIAYLYNSCINNQELKPNEFTT